MVSAALITSALCEVPLQAVSTRVWAADGRASLRIRGEAQRSPGWKEAGAADDRWVLEIARSAGGASVRIMKVHPDGSSTFSRNVYKATAPFSLWNKCRAPEDYSLCDLWIPHSLPLCMQGSLKDRYTAAKRQISEDGITWSPNKRANGVWKVVTWASLILFSALRRSP